MAGTREWRAAGLPGAGGVGAAEALARLMSAIANEGRLDGQNLLSDDTVEQLIAERIHLLPVEQFDTRAAWAATIAHEAGHWTGHPARLARSFGKRFGDQAYAFEELVALSGQSAPCLTHH